MSAESVGPPKRRAGNSEVKGYAIWAWRQVHFTCPGNTFVSEIVDDNGCTDIAVGHNFDLSRQACGGSRYLLWQDVQIFHAALVPRSRETGRQTAGYETWPPIPAVLIWRLARVRTCLFALIVAGRQLVVHLGHKRQDFVDRRTKADPQRIGAGFEKAFTVRAPGAKHVVGI